MKRNTGTNLLLILFSLNVMFFIANIYTINNLRTTPYAFVYIVAISILVTNIGIPVFLLYAKTQAMPCVIRIFAYSWLSITVIGTVLFGMVSPLNSLYFGVPLIIKLLF